METDYRQKLNKMQESQETSQVERQLLPTKSKLIKMLDPQEDPQVLSTNFTKIIPIDIIKQTKKLYWGGNGVGDRWANKKYNYGVVYSNKEPKIYSENDDDAIPPEILKAFLETNKGTGIIGIFVFSNRENNQKRPINKIIHKEITSKSCVICGTKTDIICDHKNDLYNDERVLDSKRQKIDDFQPLCNHCNLQKRQVCKQETQTQKIYSAKNITRYQQYRFEFPWEKKVFDKTDIYCKNDTYWFDPVEFDKKIYCYMSYVIPIVNEIKRNPSPFQNVVYTNSIILS
jgi:hypothetical protein